MTELRQRMIDAMVQRGFSARTQETYIRAIRRMAKHYRRDPALYTPQEVQGEDAAWRERQRQLYQHDWVVYAKTLPGGPAQVLEYLSRYTHRTAIGNQRIRAIIEDDVVFSVRAETQGSKRTVRLDGPEFVRRFMLHVLPTGIKRIRRNGVLASACKAQKLAQAREALQMPTPHPVALESAGAFLHRVACMDVAKCPCCGRGQLRTAAVLPSPTRLPAPGAVDPARPAALCRGPP